MASGVDIHKLNDALLQSSYKVSTLTSEETNKTDELTRLYDFFDAVIETQKKEVNQINWCLRVVTVLVAVLALVIGYYN